MQKLLDQVPGPQHQQFAGRRRPATPAATALTSATTRPATTSPARSTTTSPPDMPSAARTSGTAITPTAPMPRTISRPSPRSTTLPTPICWPSPGAGPHGAAHQRSPRRLQPHLRLLPHARSISAPISSPGTPYSDPVNEFMPQGRNTNTYSALRRRRLPARQPLHPVRIPWPEGPRALLRCRRDVSPPTASPWAPGSPP